MLALDRRIVENVVDARQGLWNKGAYSKAAGLTGMRRCRRRRCSQGRVLARKGQGGAGVRPGPRRPGAGKSGGGWALGQAERATLRCPRWTEFAAERALRDNRGPQGGQGPAMGAMRDARLAGGCRRLAGDCRALDGSWQDVAACREGIKEGWRVTVWRNGVQQRGRHRHLKFIILPGGWRRTHPLEALWHRSPHWLFTITQRNRKGAENFYKISLWAALSQVMLLG